MRVMVVDPDEPFTSEVEQQLTQAGFEVVCAASPDQMHAHMRTRDFQAVMIDLSLRRMNGFDVARELRMETPASALAILLMSPRHRPDSTEIVTLKRDTESRFFFLKPLDYPAVIAALQEPLPEPVKAQAPPVKPVPAPPVNVDNANAAQPEAPTTSVKAAPMRQREVDWDNLKELVEIWRQKKTGTLVLAGDKSGTAALVEGGIVDDAGRKLVKQCILGGVVAFKDQAIDGVGDWARMGRLLFKGARIGTDPRKLRRYLSAVPTPNEHTVLARSLPLTSDSRAFVGRINGTQTVGEILDAGGFPLSEVSRDITALVQLGLVTFQRSDVESEAPVGEVQPSHAREVSGMNRTQVRDANASLDQSQLLQRLEKEFLTIRDALPPVVLGVPADADRSLVDSAGARMRQRYAEIIARPDVSSEVRNMALEIAKKVDSAHRNFNFDADLRTGTAGHARISVHDEVDDMLSQGRALIDAKRWVEADKLLSRAHEKRIDHVAVLANLGWARLHNPEQDLEQRTEEGMDFLLLAEQFDPTDGDGQYYMAQVLVASNRLDAAEQRAARAADAAPDDAARAALLRKIRILRQQQESANT